MQPHAGDRLAQNMQWSVRYNQYHLVIIIVSSKQTHPEGGVGLLTRDDYSDDDLLHRPT